RPRVTVAAALRVGRLVAAGLDVAQHIGERGQDLVPPGAECCGGGAGLRCCGCEGCHVASELGVDVVGADQAAHTTSFWSSSQRRMSAGSNRISAPTRMKGIASAATLFRTVFSETQRKAATSFTVHSRSLLSALPCVTMIHLRLRGNMRHQSLPASAKDT